LFTATFTLVYIASETSQHLGSFLCVVYDYRKETRLCTLRRWPDKKKLWKYLFNVVPKLTFSHRFDVSLCFSFQFSCKQDRFIPWRLSFVYVLYIMACDGSQFFLGF